MIRITPSIAIDEDLLRWSFVRSSGPGGQNVNKVSTAAELEFDLAAAPLPAEVKDRLRKLAGRRMTGQGVLRIKASQFRSQSQNRQAAMERLTAMIRQAAVRPRLRRATAPTRASRRRRLEDKKRRSAVKTLRRDDPQ